MKQPSPHTAAPSRDRGRDRRFIWWSLATLVAALAMAVLMSMLSGTSEAYTSAAFLQSVLLMVAVICLPMGLAALLGGLAMTLTPRTRPLAFQLFGYAALLAAAVMVVLLVATTPLAS